MTEFSELTFSIPVIPARTTAEKYAAKRKQVRAVHEALTGLEQRLGAITGSEWRLLPAERRTQISGKVAELRTARVRILNEMERIAGRKLSWEKILSR